MSSGTSTESAAIPVTQAGKRQGPATHGGRERRAETFEPWQLFTLAGLLGATLVVFLARGQSPASVIVLSLVVFAAAAVGVAALRMVTPLTRHAREETAATLGERTRAALEREKALVLRSIKELEFDHAMGKVSDGDFAEMSVRLRTRAAGLLRQLDAGPNYREVIEREIEQRVASAPAAALPPADMLLCAVCDTRNDHDARFCKGCGATLGPAA